MCQDLMVPAKNAVALLEYMDKNFPFYPTGFCLMKPEPRSDLQCNGIEADLLVNIGVYGKRITPHAAFVQANRYIESTLKKLGGKKWFYAHSYYTSDEFWRIYDKKRYEKIRKIYHATYLPSINKKVVVPDKFVNFTQKNALRILII